ncbi:Membrane dipeptidase [Parvibaculum lavamentivorans DS-1]|uniref:Membrane dipeptidase n=1 Tax=Parvibaculum lavamentivorans (strain DS-1 / DSM 13023 / NCIMB 13966) TaxID=402881 RepID=A7HZ56_PARL1|nr:dipeptidase [Parvibaculum lavamentivorans]ABS65189.1 Membrane dipeptidase [Parvibaculum lavamentivorans DS-1]
MKMNGRRYGIAAALAVLLLAALWTLRPGLTPAEAEPTPEEIAARIHKSAIVIDTHVDIPSFFGSALYDPGLRNAYPVQVDLPRMREGGLDAAFFIVYVSQTERGAVGYAEAASEALAKFAAIRRMTDIQYKDEIGLALDAADVRRLHGEGKRIALIGIENGYSVAKEPALLDFYYDLGARYFGLVHNGHNDLSDSAQPQEKFADKPNEEGGEHDGLSELGRAMVARANDLGLMVDVSHASRAAALDAIAASRAPVIASHSSVHALRPHPRNMTDEEMLALKEKGGVIQIVAFDEYLHDVPEEKKAARRDLAVSLGLTSLDAFFSADAETKSKFVAGVAELDAKWPRATVATLADHIDYAVKLIGIDHVGIASDFQGGGGIEGWSHAGETANVTIELVRRGYDEEQIAKLWGGNQLRVMEAAEKARKAK